MSFGSTKNADANLIAKRISSHSSMNEDKKTILKKHFKRVKKFKNKISRHIFNHLRMLLDRESKKILLTHFKDFKHNQLYSWEIQKIFQQTVDFYSNSIDTLIKNQSFKIQDNGIQTVIKDETSKLVKNNNSISFEYYKKNLTLKNGKTIKNGDVKSMRIEFTSNTPFIRVLNFLLYCDDSMLDSALKSFPVVKEEVQATPLYQAKIKKIEAFNKEIQQVRQSKYWPRLKQLVLNKKDRIVRKVQLIEYSTGSYMKIPRIGKTQISYVYKNDELRHKYWYCFKLGKDSINIPLAYNSAYHKKFKNISLDTIHYVKLSENGRVNIGLTYDDQHEYFKPLAKNSVIHKQKLCGIDLNVASNFCTIAYHDREEMIDYDRTYVEQVVNKLLEFNKRGYNNLNALQTAELGKLLRGVEFYFKKLISEIITQFINNGIEDIVLEDLDLSQCVASHIIDKGLNIKYSKMIRLLRLSSIKTWFKEQANHRGIRVHVTTPSYTSKTCSNCKCVEHTSRNGRNFECLVCGFIGDADKNASRNIYDRIWTKVSRDSLHVLEKGQYVARAFKRQAVKGLLTEWYDGGTLIMNVSDQQLAII